MCKNKRFNKNMIKILIIFFLSFINILLIL